MRLFGATFTASLTERIRLAAAETGFTPNAPARRVWGCAPGSVGLAPTASPPGSAAARHCWRWSSGVSLICPRHSGRSRRRARRLPRAQGRPQSRCHYDPVRAQPTRRYHRNRPYLPSVHPRRPGMAVSGIMVRPVPCQRPDGATSWRTAEPPSETTRGKQARRRPRQDHHEWRRVSPTVMAGKARPALPRTCVDQEPALPSLRVRWGQER
jgi:hypothetical protein